MMACIGCGAGPRIPLDALERTALAAAGGPAPALVSAVCPSGNVGALLLEHRPSATVGQRPFSFGVRRPVGASNDSA